MTLRARLLLFFAGLVGLLGLAEWWLVASLTERLHEERRQDALEVSEAIFHSLGLATELPDTGILTFEAGIGPVAVGRRLSTQVVLGEGELPPQELLAQIEAGGPVALDGWEEMPEPARASFEAMLRHLAESPPPFLAGPPPELVASASVVHDGFPAEALPEGMTPEESVLITVFSPTAIDDAGHPVSYDLAVPLPGEGPDLRLQAFRSRLLLGTGGVLLLGLAVAAFGAHRIGVPLRDLARTARQVEGGRFGATVPPGGGGGEVGEVVGAFNSMSLRLAELQEETDRLREQAHLTELGELARGLAHAMRNPLNVLGLAAQRLAAEQDGPERRAELAESVQAQVRRVDHALRSFLALSSGGRGPAEEVRLLELCRDVALELVQSAEEGPAVKVEPPAAPVPLRGAPAEVRALVHVLVVNAAEASEPGAEVLVRLEPLDGSGCRVEVLDRGCGLAPELRQELFTPHFTTKEHGAGLGLYLAHRIATSRYRGDLRLEDREGGGCRAVLELRSPEEDDRA